MTWSESFLSALKDNAIRLVSYVPDNVLMPLIKGATADIVAIARGAGIEAEWARDEAHYDKLIARRHEEVGPYLVAAKIDDTHAEVQTPRDPTLIRQRFMHALSARLQSASDG